MDRSRTLRLILTTILMIVALAACGGDEPAPAAPSNGEDAAPPAASSGNFSVEITRDVEVTMPPGRATYVHYPTLEEDLFSIPEHYELVFTHREGSVTYQVLIQFVPGLQPGTYAFDSDQFGMSYETASAEFDFLDTSGEVLEWSSLHFGPGSDGGPDGSLTLDSVGNTASGSFTFTADSVEFDDDGQEIRQSVTVTGTFSDLELIEGEW
jgi:hypothetical protein